VKGIIAIVTGLSRYNGATVGRMNIDPQANKATGFTRSRKKRRDKIAGYVALLAGTQ